MFLRINQKIKKSFPLLEKLFSMEELIELVKTPASDLWFYHFGLGTWIRNHLLNENQLYQMFLSMGIQHKDDMFFYIILRFHAHMVASYKYLS